MLLGDVQRSSGPMDSPGILQCQPV
jgi:hypothetical protein